jgi:diguanylate cyclase (GGDEF)-like protein
MLADFSTLARWIGPVRGFMVEQQGSQAARSLCDQLQITAEELRTRLAFLSFGEQDRRNLVEFHDVIASHIDEIIGEFYSHLLQFEELRGILSDATLVERLKGSQRQYLLSLGQLGDDVEYVEGRLRVGLTHERVGLKQKWYLGAYHKLFELILQRLAVRYSGDACRLSSLVLTLNKILTLDEIFVVETYYYATTQRQEDSLSQLKDAHRQLIEISRLDPLTQADNRRALMESLELELRRSHRYHHPFALLFLDIDHFKEINDRYGHAFGDKVLQRIVGVARGQVRPPDIIGRYGGEEFAIGLVECSLEGAQGIAERIRLRIAESSIVWEQNVASVTVSIGITMLTPEVDRVETLIDQADRALYEAKAGGRNRVKIF